MSGPGKRAAPEVLGVGSAWVFYCIWDWNSKRQFSATEGEHRARSGQCGIHGHTKPLELGLMCFSSFFTAEKQLENAGGTQKETKVSLNMPLLTLSMCLCSDIFPCRCRNRGLCAVAQVVHCTAPFRGEVEMAPPGGVQ